MVAAGTGGHDWVLTSENKTNLQASCRRCTLFVQQVHKPAVFDRIEAHPCLGREQPVPEGAGVHPSHNMANVGRAWICKRCFIHLWVSYEKILQGVVKQCRPSRKEAREGGGQLAPFLPVEHRPSSLQTEQQPATVPRRSKNRARVESGSPSCKEPPQLHSFFTTPPHPLPAAACPPQDLGSREVGSKQQHNQHPASQPRTQPDTLFPGSRPGQELEVLQAGSSLGPAPRCPPPSLPKNSRQGSRRDEGTSPIACKVQHLPARIGLKVKGHRRKRWRASSYGKSWSTALAPQDRSTSRPLLLSRTLPILLMRQGNPNHSPWLSPTSPGGGRRFCTGSSKQARTASWPKRPI